MKLTGNCKLVEETCLKWYLIWRNLLLGIKNQCQYQDPSCPTQFITLCPDVCGYPHITGCTTYCWRIAVKCVCIYILWWFIYIYIYIVVVYIYIYIYTIDLYIIRVVNVWDGIDFKLCLTHWPLGDLNEIFKLILVIVDWGILLWICSQMNVTGPYWWWVNIGSGNGLVPSANKPLPEPMLTRISVAIWRH